MSCISSISLQEHKTPLDNAVDQWQVDVVKCLVEELQMDLRKFDEVDIVLPQYTL